MDFADWGGVCIPPVGIFSIIRAYNRGIFPILGLSTGKNGDLQILLDDYLDPGDSGYV